MLSNCLPCPAPVAMFRWRSLQPIPTTLAALLAEAGLSRCGFDEPAELTVFLPPHLLVNAGIEHGDDLAQAYVGLNCASHLGQLVNGERLLGVRPAELAHWLASRTLQRPWELSTVDPLLAAVTITLLMPLPLVEQHYQALDAVSLRGEAPEDHDYRRRLQPSNSALLAGWNALTRQQNSTNAQSLQALAKDLEQQVISTQEAKEQLAAHQRSGRYLMERLSHANQLLQRLMLLHSRAWEHPGPSNLPIKH
jgi:hypothetical protein